MAGMCLEFKITCHLTGVEFYHIFSENLSELPWIHRYDVIAQLHHARRLAEKLQPCAKMIELHGGHLVSHERTEEVLF